MLHRDVPIEGCEKMPGKKQQSKNFQNCIRTLQNKITDASRGRLAADNFKIDSTVPIHFLT